MDFHFFGNFALTFIRTSESVNRPLLKAKTLHSDQATYCFGPYRPQYVYPYKPNNNLDHGQIGQCPQGELIYACSLE